MADVVAGIAYVFDHQSWLYRQNTLINSNVLEASTKSKTIHEYIYVGTACSYPLELQSSYKAVALHEDQTYPAHPESAYGWSKLMAEYEADLALQNVKGLSKPFRIGLLRFHNLYGPKAIYADKKGSQALPALVRKALHSPRLEPFEIWGSGQQYRDFLYVDDAVQGLLAMQRHGMNRGVIQIGSGVPVTLRKAADIIAGLAKKCLGKDLTVVTNTKKREGDRGRVAYLGKADEFMSWKAQVAIEEGLARLFKWIVEDMKLHATLEPWMLGSATADSAIECLGQSANAARGKPCEDCPVAVVQEGISRQWRAPWFLSSGTLANRVVAKGKLRILYWDPLAKEHEKYQYYWDFAEPLLRMHQVCLLAAGSIYGNPLMSAKCRDLEFDVVVIGFGIVNQFQQLAQKRVPVQQQMQWVKNSTAPIVFMMNKEYAALSAKLQWLAYYRRYVMCAFTVHHHFEVYETQTGVPFYRLPFAVNPEKFDLQRFNSNSEYKYDIGFTGHLGSLQRGNWRGRIKAELGPRFERAGIRFFYSAWLNASEYADTKAHTKIWLSTQSSGDIINPTYFETLASGTTMLACVADSIGAYKDLQFEDGHNMIMFGDLEELHRKVLRFANESASMDKQRLNIVRHGRELVQKYHTYKLRALQLTDTVQQHLAANSRQ